MKVYIDEKKKIIEYWIKSSVDMSMVDSRALDSLKKQKYTVCFYQSGYENIKNVTNFLLKENI